MVTVLAEDSKNVLIRIDDIVNIGGVDHKVVRHEIWHNKEMMRKGIKGDDDYIYCSGYNGYTDEQVLKRFQDLTAIK